MIGRSPTVTREDLEEALAALEHRIYLKIQTRVVVTLIILMAAFGWGKVFGVI